MNLKDKSLNDLRVIADGLGIPIQNAAKEASLIAQIENKLASPTPAPQNEVNPQTGVEITPEKNTEKDVREALTTLVKQKPEFEMEFPKDGTWVFRCKGAEESGNLNIPLRVIKNRAAIVARGALRLRALGRDKRDGSYAGNILST